MNNNCNYKLVTVTPATMTVSEALLCACFKENLAAVTHNSVSKRECCVVHEQFTSDINYELNYVRMFSVVRWMLIFQCFPPFACVTNYRVC
jgi:hypothetical protein